MYQLRTGSVFPSIFGRGGTWVCWCSFHLTKSTNFAVHAMWAILSPGKRQRLAKCVRNGGSMYEYNQAGKKLVS